MSSRLEPMDAIVNNLAHASLAAPHKNRIWRRQGIERFRGASLHHGYVVDRVREEILATNFYTLWIDFDCVNIAFWSKQRSLNRNGTGSGPDIPNNAVPADAHRGKRQEPYFSFCDQTLLRHALGEEILVQEGNCLGRRPRRIRARQYQDVQCSDVVASGKFVDREPAHTLIGSAEILADPSVPIWIAIFD